ncbi:L-threonylcarbamoyladenylate synthase [Streptomyces filamentosus]|uniref:L-threonylcarbamoyladenylate synthase n=1 Tax=Streptomyces filamentosus TaxID=67294 RepID=UPI0037CDBD7C
MSVQQATAVRTLVLGDPEDVREAAAVLAAGRAVAHGFGNVYALTCRPERDAVEDVNRLKGRPAGQPADLTTVPERIPSAFDWTRLPDDVPRQQIRSLAEELLGLGPIGLRGPAADRVPGALTADDDGVRTVRVVAPGTRCPSHAFLGAALALTGGDFLAVTSANRSHHATGRAHEPAHWRAAGLAGEFGGDPGVRILAHADEEAARRRHPFHRATSVSVLSFHRTAGRTRSGLPALVLERHGSLSADHIRAVAANHGFGLALAPHATRPLPPRPYAAGSPRATSAHTVFPSVS